MLTHKHVATTETYLNCSNTRRLNRSDVYKFGIVLKSPSERYSFFGHKRTLHVLYKYE